MSGMLFRQDVIEAARDRLEGTVIAATPPRAPTYLAIALAVLIAMVALLTFGNFATKVRVTGVVSYGGGVARVYTSSPVEIRALHVREGAIVAAGAPLATVSVTQGRNASGDGMHSQIRELERQDGELARQQQLAQSSSGIDVESLAQQRASLSASIASIDRQQQLGSVQLGLSQSESDRAARLAKQGAGSRRQAEIAKAATVQHELDIETLKERAISQREALRQINVQLAQRRLGSEQKISEIAAQRAALAEQRAALMRLDRLVLTAPIAGRVSDLVATVGQRARPESSLMTVVPTGSTLEVWLYAPSRAVGFVRPGDQVRLMFDAFPFQKYGAGTGTVIGLSSIPTDPGAIAAATGLAIQEPVYRIRVKIDRAGGNGAIGRPLRPGMTLSANLVTERRRLWEVFFDPILRSWRQ
ncbi:MAG TPA: HlyD family efflux transporter periplasmic adaptor subunit [Sphingobium sp.]|uniref:HlyD family secretion protein n=1 Tax=Sphingobium sp. TaxID=1912891 RepID=UPI002ED576D9